VHVHGIKQRIGQSLRPLSTFQLSTSLAMRYIGGIGRTYQDRALFPKWQAAFVRRNQDRQVYPETRNDFLGTVTARRKICLRVAFQGRLCGPVP